MGITGISILYPDAASSTEEVTMPAKKDNYDDTDVSSALERETADGPGFDQNHTDGELPESDFTSFAEDGVENDHDGDNVGDDQDSQ